MASADTRLIIAGGGLAGCLTALALARLRPEVPIMLVEGGTRFGGTHTWSFFDPDVAEGDRWLVDPFLVARWSAYDVRFPRRARTLSTAYNSASSDRLDAVMRERLRPDQYRLGCAIEAVAPDHLRLAGGETLGAVGVLDARGAPDSIPLDLGWQKFVGREFRLARPHGLERPTVMDATVDQAEGYRFVYCLPFSPTRMLVEDTYYSLSPRLAVEPLRDRIDAYVAARGWQPAALEKEETGVLPVALGGNVASLCRFSGRAEAGPARRLLPSNHRLFATRRGSHRLAGGTPGELAQRPSSPHPAKRSRAAVARATLLPAA